MKPRPVTAHPLAALVLLALAACAAQEETEKLVEAPPVMVTPVVARDLVDRVEATGQLVAKAEATIAAQVGGQITAVAAREGEAHQGGEDEEGAGSVEHDVEEGSRPRDPLANSPPEAGPPKLCNCRRWALPSSEFLCEGDCLEHALCLVDGFLVLCVRLGISHQPGAALHINFPVLDGRRTDSDTGIEVAVV